MIAVPAASGFIPNTSIFDEILKWRSQNSPEAKAKSAAETDLLRANAEGVRSGTSYAGDTSAQNWAKIGIAGNESKAGIGQGNQRLDLERTKTILDSILRSVGMKNETATANRQMDINAPRVEAETNLTNKQAGAITPENETLTLLSRLSALNPGLLDSNVMKMITDGVAHSAMSKVPQAEESLRHGVNDQDRKVAQMWVEHPEPGNPQYETAKRRYPDLFGASVHPPSNMQPQGSTISVTGPDGRPVTMAAPTEHPSPGLGLFEQFRSQATNPQPVPSSANAPAGPSQTDSQNTDGMIMRLLEALTKQQGQPPVPENDLFPLPLQDMPAPVAKPAGRAIKQPTRR